MILHAPRWHGSLFLEVWSLSPCSLFSHLNIPMFIIDIAWSQHGKARILLKVGAWVELSFTMVSGQSDIPRKKRGEGMEYNACLGSKGPGRL